MPTMKINSGLITNEVYTSVKLLSTTKAIDTAIDMVHKSIQSLPTKNIVCSIQNELNTISECNNILQSDIAPSLTSTSISPYCHKRIKFTGPDRLCHVDSAISVTPEKRSIPCKGNTRTSRTKR